MSNKKDKDKISSTHDNELTFVEPWRKRHKSLENTHEREKSNQNNIIKYFENLQRGHPTEKYRYSVKLSLIDHIKSFRVSKVEAPFDRRVTFIDWHPRNQRLLAVASKSGDIVLWNYEHPFDDAYLVKGIGAGGSIQAMKFDSVTPYKIYTVSIEGKFLFLNFERKKAKQFLDTSDVKKWYVSLDINWRTRTMVVGDNKGFLTILTTEGAIIDRIQVHKSMSKVTHSEFSKREPNLLCTTSNDRFVKFWDIRHWKKNQKGMATPILTIENEKPINAAYFSLTDGSRLLTTDQFDKICVYRSPLWELETKIRHPHRQFQHLTPIRAHWHPLEDIILIGRYPHKDFPGYVEDELRTIDFFDAATGELLHQHSESGYTGIASLNRFNAMGDAMASGTGTKIIIWEPDFKTLVSSKSTPVTQSIDVQEDLPRRRSFRIAENKKNSSQIKMSNTLKYKIRKA